MTAPGRTVGAHLAGVIGRRDDEAARSRRPGSTGGAESTSEARR
jgi:hypothetical protein